MEWLILMVVMAVLLVPIVLLFGFAGCHLAFPLDPPPPVAPANLLPTVLGATRISLSWVDGNTAPVRFEVRRKEEGAIAGVIFQADASPFVDTGLEEDTAYFYQVQAFRIDSGDSSELSDEVSATTLAFQPAFEAVLDTDQAIVEGYCLVQRIEPARLLRSGAEVRITIRGSTTGALALNAVSISQPAATGDPYDSANDLSMVSGPVTLAAGTPAILPTIQYALDRTRPLLIAFDVNPPANLRYVTNVPATEAIMYFKPNAAEAGIEDRQPSLTNPGADPYDTSASIYLVERIDVA